MRKLILALFILMSPSVWSATECEQKLAFNNVIFSSNIDNGLLQGPRFEIDPELLFETANSKRLVDVVIYPKQKIIDAIFTKPLPKSPDEYPEYKDEIAEMNEVLNERLDSVAESLFNGDKDAARAHMEKGQISTVQQWEFEKNELQPYLESVGTLNMVGTVQRVSQFGWMLEKLPFHEALRLLALLKTQDSWLESLQIFEHNSPLTECASGSCSIKQ